MKGLDVEVSEPYYYISGFHANKPRIEVLDFSCVTLGSSGHFFTKKDSGIETMDQLVAKILNTPSSVISNRSVGFIGKGNFDSNSDLLPENVDAKIETNHSMIEEQVRWSIQNAAGPTS